MALKENILNWRVRSVSRKKIEFSLETGIRRIKALFERIPKYGGCNYLTRLLKDDRLVGACCLRCAGDRGEF